MNDLMKKKMIAVHGTFKLDLWRRHHAAFAKKKPTQQSKELLSER